MKEIMYTGTFINYVFSLIFFVVLITGIVIYVVYNEHKLRMEKTPLDARKDMDRLFLRMLYKSDIGLHAPIETYEAACKVAYAEINDYLLEMQRLAKKMYDIKE